MCDYSFENKTTLQKHMKTKHEVINIVHKSKPEKKLLNHMVECQEGGKKDKLYCIECRFSCIQWKNLKEHE